MQIDVTDLSIRYGTEPPVISDLSHDFAAGAVTAIIGASGSGKSTLLYALALMLSPADGSIRWNGESTDVLSDAARAQLRARHSGFVFQDALLDLAQTALDNVLEAAWLGRRFDAEVRGYALSLLERFGVAAHAHKRPGQLSGGQAQRIALCRALVRRPAVIFADEPTGNLDPGSAGVVWQALADAAADGATVIVATHDLDRAHALDHVLDLSVATIGADR